MPPAFIRLHNVYYRKYWDSPSRGEPNFGLPLLRPIYSLSPLPSGDIHFCASEARHWTGWFGLNGTLACFGKCRFKATARDNANPWHQRSRWRSPGEPAGSRRPTPCGFKHRQILTKPALARGPHPSFPLYYPCYPTPRRENLESRRSRTERHTPIPHCLPYFTFRRPHLIQPHSGFPASRRRPPGARADLPIPSALLRTRLHANAETPVETGLADIEAPDTEAAGGQAGAAPLPASSQCRTRTGECTFQCDAPRQLEHSSERILGFG